MAHFYGKLIGGIEKESTRRGTKRSGIITYCASWTGAVRCHAYIDGEGVDCVLVEKVCWQGAGEMIPLYDGPIGAVEKGQTEVFGSREVKP